MCLNAIPDDMHMPDSIEYQWILHRGLLAGEEEALFQKLIIMFMCTKYEFLLSSEKTSREQPFNHIHTI